MVLVLMFVFFLGESFPFQEVIEMMYTLGVEVDLVSYGLLSMTCKTTEEAEAFFAEIERNNVK